MQPISGQPPVGPRVGPHEPARVPVGPRAPVVAGDRAQPVGAASAPSLVALLGRVPAGAIRPLRLLLAPPAGGPPAGFRATSMALRGAVRRGSIAGRPDDPLLCAAGAAPQTLALRAAIEREQRLVQVVGELCGMRDDVAAGIASVTVG